MNVWFWVFISYILINFFLMISMIFFERKKLTSIISWMTVLTFLPWIGFLIYLIFGSGLCALFTLVLLLFERNIRVIIGAIFCVIPNMIYVLVYYALLHK